MFVIYYAASIWHTPTIGPSENTDVWLPDYSSVVISTRGGAAVYNSLFRTLWSLGVGLMIFLCDQGSPSLSDTLTTLLRLWFFDRRLPECFNIQNIITNNIFGLFNAYSSLLGLE